MKVFFIFLFLFFIPNLIFAQHNIDSLIHVLDKTVENYQMYVNQKEQRLGKLNAEINLDKGDAYNYSIYQQLYEDYKSYKVDSAIHYAIVKLDMAKRLNDPKKIYTSQLDLAHIWGIAGMYLESLKILKNLDSTLFPDLKVRYLDVYRTVLGYMTDYAVEREKSRYTATIETFRDSLVLFQDPNSVGYMIDKSYNLFNKGKEKDAFKLLLTYFSSKQHTKRDKAYIAYTIAALYKRKADREHEKYWLTVSAINDLQSTNKEYLSLGDLAFILYEEGDFERAYKYIKRSWEDAIFCNSRIRIIGISKMLPIIDNAYQAKEKALKKQLIDWLVSISVFVILLFIAVLIIYKQMRKLVAARKELGIANEDLFTINKQLKGINNRLLESNMIKEEYIGHYINQCSVYIEKLENYRRMLNRKGTTVKIDDLLRTLKSNQFIKDEIKEFYQNFDSTFLQLFPTFVKDFSKLLDDDEEVPLKPGQLLNTELRIYALTRLGITDGAKISQLLRCNASTIYNYRYKIRNMAKYSRGEFEDKVMQIGAHNN